MKYRIEATRYDNKYGIRCVIEKKNFLFWDLISPDDIKYRGIYLCDIDERFKTGGYFSGSNLKKFINDIENTNLQNIVNSVNTAMIMAKHTIDKMFDENLEIGGKKKIEIDM